MDRRLRESGEKGMRIAIIGLDERFVRTSDSSLASCDAAFADRKLGNLQLVLSRSGEPLHPTPVLVGAAADPLP